MPKKEKEKQFRQRKIGKIFCLIGKLFDRLFDSTVQQKTDSTVQQLNDSTI